MSNSGWQGNADESAADTAGDELKHKEIAPLDLDFSAIDGQPSEVVDAASDAQASQHKLVLPLLGLLCAVAAAVILVPLLNTDFPAEQSPTPMVEDVQDESQRIDEGTPFQEAELAKLRKEAQDTLEQLLEKRLWLEKKNVALWAADSFDRSTELASEGDEEYRNRQFSEAKALYAEGLAIVSALLDGVPETIDVSMQRGLAAIEGNRPEEAREAFELVRAIEADHEGATTGLQRVTVLKPVNEALSQAAEFERQEEYQQALAAIEQVLALDAVRAATLTPRIEELKQTILDQRFAEQMSLGFRSLDMGERARAGEHFAKANQLKPDQDAPKKALQMVRNQQSLNRMSVHLTRAADLEKNEQWSAAVDSYDRALAIDANLSDAAERRAAAEKRMKLDQAIETLNNDPLRLAQSALYEKGVKLHAAAQRIDNPGPRLSNQIRLLGSQLRASRESLPVVIKSDGVTQVSVQQVARLGSLQERSLNLIPGRYVAVGSRDGYRDVRREFVVQQGARNVQVEIRCVEPI